MRKVKQALQTRPRRKKKKKKEEKTSAHRMVILSMVTLVHSLRIESKPRLEDCNCRLQGESTSERWYFCSSGRRDDTRRSVSVRRIFSCDSFFE
jgi:hypothetical protein